MFLYISYKNIRYIQETFTFKNIVLKIYLSNRENIVKSFFHSSWYLDLLLRYKDLKFF